MDPKVEFAMDNQKNSLLSALFTSFFLFQARFEKSVFTSKKLYYPTIWMRFY